MDYFARPSLTETERPSLSEGFALRSAIRNRTLWLKPRVPRVKVYAAGPCSGRYGCPLSNQFRCGTSVDEPAHLPDACIRAGQIEIHLSEG